MDSPSNETELDKSIKALKSAAKREAFLEVIKFLMETEIADGYPNQADCIVAIRKNFLTEKFCEDSGARLRD